ncbi:MAG: hypothetical protein IK990_20965, partial [Ruminiclostridium sp.]|nr:hypothetical protein [Ruminiclostridium sp.]
MTVCTVRPGADNRKTGKYITWLSSLAEKKQQLETEKDKSATIPMLLMKYLDIRKAERSDWKYGQQTA